MALVNVSVYCQTLKRMLLPWRIMSDDSPDSTFGTLFREKVKPSVTHECELERVYVGRDKVCLDETDMSLNVAQVTSTFGSFVKYTVRTLMVQCEECGMWRLIYSKKKVSSQAKSELERKLSNFDFSCGASTSDMDLPDELSDVHFRDLRCEDPVEKLYYSMGYEQICIYCSTEDDLDTSENYYPICVSCMSNKEPISKK